jgi:signal transduction histidine kinase
MVYGFAHQSGGTAAIRSEIGHGTAVTLHLPRSANPQRASSTPGQGALADRVS